MGKVKGKRGRNARRARQGRLGLVNPGKPSKKKDKQFSKRQEHRVETKERKRDLEELQENVREKLPVQEESKLPHSFVIHTGRVGKYVRRLERDIRQMMRPNTSTDLKVTKRNHFKDFLVHSKFLGVSHLVVLRKSETAINMRIIRNNFGPTLHFQVQTYTLAREVLASQKRPVIYEELFHASPLVILTGFNQPNKKHLNLVQTVIQHMFPSIDVDKVQLKSIRRAVLVDYDKDEDCIQIRHYSIKHVPTGLSRSTKKLMQSKIPDLSSYEDVSEYMLNPGALSDSEYEGEQVELDLPQDVNKRGLTKGHKTKIRLVEIGPRMTWKLVKIEEGINSGDILYHAEKKPDK